jgi:hypothetical protein
VGYYETYYLLMTVAGKRPVCPPRSPNKRDTRQITTPQAIARTAGSYLAGAKQDT